ncbi:MAG: hypothetical protein ACLGQU_00545, partial [Acidobacteriota bacterium]
VSTRQVGGQGGRGANPLARKLAWEPFSEAGAEVRSGPVCGLGSGPAGNFLRAAGEAACEGRFRAVRVHPGGVLQKWPKSRIHSNF